MTIKCNLEFCFKGARNYVQGPDIFDAAIKKIQLNFDKSTVMNIKYSAHEMLLANADLIITDNFNKDDYEKINSIITFQVNKIKYHAVVIQNQNNINCSSEYSENIVRTGSNIKDERISFTNTLDDSLTEIIVSMNKYYLQKTITEKSKWIVTKFDYNNLLDLEDLKDKKLQLELTNNFNNKLTKSTIKVENKVVGHLYFSLI